MSAKSKHKIIYHQIPLIQKGCNCPICGTEFVRSKLMLALYDGLNINSIQHLGKTLFCNSCHTPFITLTDAKQLESEYPGYHMETMRFTKRFPSREIMQRLIVTLPKPIKNIPKNTVIFAGEPGKHACGEDRLTRYKGLFHGETHEPIDIWECDSCKKIIIQPSDYNRAMKQFPDYFYINDVHSWTDLYPNKKVLYLLNINQYTTTTCPSCNNRLDDCRMYFKNDKSPKMIAKSIKTCTKCGASFGRITSFENKQYSIYRFAKDFYADESFRTDGKIITLTSGDFLTRHNLSGCLDNGHSLEDITARVKIARKDGSETDYDIPAIRCDTCGKLFILEKEYEKIMQAGIPLCAIVENEYWRTAPSKTAQWSESEARGSVMFIHGYNVNAQNDLTAGQRHSILRSLLKDDVLTKGQICAHLDTLIQRAGSQKHLQTAKAKWEADRAFMNSLEQDTDVVSVNSITHTTYRTKE